MGEPVAVKKARDLTAADRERASDALHKIDDFLANDVMDIVARGRRILSKWPDKSGADISADLAKLRDDKNLVEHDFDVLMGKLKMPLALVDLSPQAAREALRVTHKPMQDVIHGIAPLETLFQMKLLVTPVMNALNEALGKVEAECTAFRDLAHRSNSE